MPLCIVSVIGIFINVTENEFSGNECYLNTINEKQSNHLQVMPSKLKPSQIEVMEADDPCALHNKNMTDLQ